jgi:hypothetical protein
MRSGLRAVGALRSEEQRSEEPVALETPVVATGARPGHSGAERELFTEETQTVLVFERGAVIRLSAAVADGQLLFLTNKITGKEVVTQVIRKRSFRPTSCYVDLEFTDACPGFWGINFPESAPVLPNASSSAKLSDEGDLTATPPQQAPRPDVQEVERLKKEVTELQTQLKSLTASGPEKQAPQEVPNGAPHTALVADKVANEQTQKLGKKLQEEKMLEQLFAQEAEQEQLQGPKRLVAYPQKSGIGSLARKAGKLATAAAFAAVVVAAAIAAYRFGLLNPLLSRAGARRPATGNLASAPNPAASSKAMVAGPRPVAASDTVSGAVSSAASKYTTSAPSNNQTTPADTEITTAVAPAPVPSGMPRATAEDLHREAKQTELTVLPAVPSAGTVTTPIDQAAPAADENGSGIAAANEDYIAPKLLHAVKPISPPDALRNYITGNVNLDALVDTTGHVRSVTVLSGPQKLRKTAIEEMRQYTYEPARKNGKVVTSHVQATLKFWYEP